MPKHAPRPRRSGRPTGRPPELDRVVRTRITPDGIEEVTASQHIIERISIGQDIGDAAAGADMPRQTVWTWRRAGAAARTREAAGHTLNIHEQAYARFLDDLEKAETEAELRRLMVITRASEGMGFLEHTTDEWVIDPDYDPAMPTLAHPGPMMLVARRVVRQQQAPVWQAAAWYLERRHPERYRRPYGEIMMGGESDADRQQRAGSLVEQMRAYMTGRDDAEADRQLSE